MIKGLAAADAERVVAARAAGRFTSFEDFARRTGLTGASLKRLSQADAFGSLALNRRQAAWQAHVPREPQPLFENHAEADAQAPAVLPPMPPFDEVVTDYHTTGLSLRNHPVAFLRDSLAQLRVTPAAELPAYPPDRWVKVGGLVLLRQRPATAKGITFVTLEDETGHVNLLVHQHIWERYRPIARGATLMLASGQLQRHNGVIHVIVTRLEDGSALLSDVPVKSRDFR